VSQSLTKLSAVASKELGLPPGLKFASPWPFAGMNQQDARTAIDDKEFFWVENYLLTGNASLRTLWDIGQELYTSPAGKTIVYFAWYNIGPTYYVAVFLSDGTAVQVQQSNGAVTTISSAPNTFYSGGQLPFAVQSGAQYLLICNNITPNSYWIWDGSVLYSAGTIGPYQIGDLTDSGTGYSSVPTVTAFGGTGSGVAITASIANGAVVSLQVTNPGTGYSPSDVVQLAFTGGGSDSSAILQSVLTAGAIGDVELISGGSGYTGVPTVSFTGGGGGSGAAATAIVTGGAVTGVTLTNPGSGYTATPTVVFSGGGGSGASAVAVLSSDSVASVTVINGGSGFIGTPTLTFSGGGGTGATATANIASGAITSVTVTNGGLGYSAPPSVVVSPGQNNAAAGSIDVMPFGVSGTSLETFLSRIWVSAPAANGTQQSASTFLVSASDSLTDFSTADGGLLFSSSDRFLRAGYTALHQSNGYLYPIGDSSVDVISNVQTSGTPVATTFNYQNTSAQVGGTWRDTIQDFGQSVLFANANGVQGLYGGSVRRVSGKVNNIFDTAFQLNPTTGVRETLPGGVTPSSAVANIHTIPVYLMLMSIIDPNTQGQRNILIGWDEKNWLAASQTVNLIFIGTQEQNSVMTAWGTDGNILAPLFSKQSSTLQKTLVTKLYGGEREMVQRQTRTVHYRATDKSTAQAGVALTGALEGAGYQTQIGIYNPPPPIYSAANPVQPNFTAPDGTAPSWNGEAANVPGSAIGATITSTSPDFVLSGLSISYTEVAISFG
jgi:hypothetical protein